MEDVSNWKCDVKTSFLTPLQLQIQLSFAFQCSSGNLFSKYVKTIAMHLLEWPPQSYRLCRHSLTAPTHDMSRKPPVPSWNPRGGVSWFWSSWFRTGYPFQRHFLERGIIFRMHESSTFVSSHLKVFKDRLLLKIRFNALTSKPLYSCYTLERSIKNWFISRTGYQF